MSLLTVESPTKEEKEDDTDYCSNEDGCCKQKPQEKIVATAVEKNKSTNGVVASTINNMKTDDNDRQQFKNLSVKVVETINKFGLDGEQMLKDVLGKHFEVILH
eukprot:gene7737-9067_t